jgi:cell division protein FtsB
MLVVRLLTVFFFLLNLLLLYGLFFSSQGILGYRQQSRQVTELEKKIVELKKKNHRLFSKIQSLKKDVHAQERLVREQLGWAKENELVIEFPTPSQKVPAE